MNDTKIPWRELYDFCLHCGSFHEQRQFAIEIMTGLREYCRFDKGLIYFFDSNGKVYDQYLFNTDSHWSTLYLEYYSKLPENKRSSIYTPYLTNEADSEISLVSWNEESAKEFIPDFIRPRGLTYTLGYAFQDLNGHVRVLSCLDKTTNENFLPSEIAFIKLAVPQFKNMYKNFFSYQMQDTDISKIDWKSTKLTPREIEIATLLCNGMSPAHISTTLSVTRATVQKHISHIYAKLHVSSQRELLARLLG